MLITSVCLEVQWIVNGYSESQLKADLNRYVSTFGQIDDGCFFPEQCLVLFCCRIIANISCNVHMFSCFNNLNSP